MRKIIINTDGGSRGNPGPAALGVVIWDEHRTKLEEHKEFLGETTNNVAEYKGLIKGLEIATKHTSGEVIVFMDSELIVRQMQGEYRVRADHLLSLYEEAKQLENRFERVTYQAVRRSDPYQVQADRLVNEALDSQ